MGGRRHAASPLGDTEDWWPSNGRGIYVPSRLLCLAGSGEGEICSWFQSPPSLPLFLDPPISLIPLIWETLGLWDLIKLEHPHSLASG